MTSKPGVFVGGDAVTGGASVIEAIYAGKQVAKYMDRFLKGEEVAEDLEDKTKRLAVYLGAQNSRYPIVPGVDYGRRQPMPMLAADLRKRDFSHTELGLNDNQAREEAKRCLRCHRPILVAGSPG
jgi:formate dehydrogenase major subunit